MPYLGVFVDVEVKHGAILAALRLDVARDLVRPARFCLPVQVRDAI